jgi:iron complex transport system permease protein
MKTRRRLAALALLWIVVLCVTPLLGSRDLDLGAAFSGREGTASTILWKLRLPRVLLALLVGGALATAGLSLQTLFRNPLAEPYTLGVASGAALGAVVAIRLMREGGEVGGGLTGLSTVGVASFLGALAAAAVVAGLAARWKTSDAPTLLLAGIAVSLSCQATILLLQFFAEPYQTFRMVRWTMGALAVVGFGEVLWLAPWALAGLFAFLLLRWELNLLLTGEELASSRGADVGRLRLRVIATASLLVGAAVAVAGPIGFVGLMVPHALRRFVGHDHGILLPAAFLGGGAFLAFCDLGARTLIAPAELPVGILTALLGGPFFLWLIAQRRR